jgi:hypothetical protein
MATRASEGEVEVVSKEVEFEGLFSEMVEPGVDAIDVLVLPNTHRPFMKGAVHMGMPL